jgi:tRNA 2-thiouridine synthesizing protein E
MEIESNGATLARDDEGYLLEPCWDDEVCRALAQAEGITLGDEHFKVIGYLRDQYREHGHTPNYRNMLKDLAELLPEHNSSTLYDLFPGGPAKQGVRIAGLPKPFGKGGY